MPVMTAWANEPLDEREYPDESDLDGDDDVLADIIYCPHCGAVMHADSPKCPTCGMWVTRRTGGLRRSRKWYVRGGRWAATVLVCNWPVAVGLGLPTLLALWIVGC